MGSAISLPFAMNLILENMIPKQRLDKPQGLMTESPNSDGRSEPWRLRGTATLLRRSCVPVSKQSQPAEIPA